MRKIILSLMALILTSAIACADTYFFWRYRSASDCTALVDGKAQDLCYQTVDQAIYKCVPTAGDCDTVGEWKKVSSAGSGMAYPGAGIPVSTGSAWGTSITNNSDNWNTAYGWGNHASAGYVTGTPWTAMGYLTTVASDSTWTGHNSYPSACTAGQYVSAIGDTLTCATPTDTGITSLTTSTSTNLTGFIKGNGSLLSADNSTYLTGNQTITLSGDASGSGTTAITVAVADDSHAHTSSTLPATTSYLGSSITEGEISLSDVTTGDFSITKHGFVPKGTNLGKYLKDDGSWGVPSGSGAPSDATYITQTANASLSAEQALGALGTGILKNTTTTGVLSIATGADLPAMSATVGGAVPTPPNNTTTFLRGDGTFAAPFGGSGTPGGSNTQIQYNRSGVFGGVDGFIYSGTSLSYTGNIGLGSATPSQKLDVAGTVKATTFNGALTGNATTATNLASDPSDCGSNTFATTIASSGNLTCSAVTYAGITAMSSANFAGMITDETGTAGKVVLDTAPVLVTPNIGIATATSVNKLTITAPATSATLTIANGKTLTATNTVNLNTMTDTKWCKYSTSGTALDCNVDPVTAVTAANSTGTIGLTAVNGSASTFLRSDGAPALGVTISPTWTGNHIFNPSSGNTVFQAGNVGIGSTVPIQKLDVNGTVKATGFVGNNGSIEFFFDGGGSAITASNTWIQIPFGFVVTSFEITADVSGSAVVDILKTTYSTYSFASVAGTDKPTLSSSNKTTSSALTGWTTTWSAGDYIQASIGAATTCTKVLVVIKGTKS